MLLQYIYNLVYANNVQVGFEGFDRRLQKIRVVVVEFCLDQEVFYDDRSIRSGSNRVFELQSILFDKDTKHEAIMPHAHVGNAGIIATNHCRFQARNVPSVSEPSLDQSFQKLG